MFACETINPDVKTVDTPVVEAFIIPGRDSVNISVKKMIGYLGTDLDTVQQPVTDCSVQLIHQGQTIQLYHDEYNPGSYTSGSRDLNIGPGDTIDLLGQYHDISFSAQTVVPDSVQNLSISGTTLYYDADNPRSMMTAGNITIEWDNEQEDFYYVFIENTETNLVPLNEMLENATKMGFAFP